MLLTGTHNLTYTQFDRAWHVVRLRVTSGAEKKQKRMQKEKDGGDNERTHSTTGH